MQELSRNLQMTEFQTDKSRQIISLAISAAIKAGDAIMEIYNGSDFDIKIKDDNTPLTKADKASHNIILKTFNDGGNKWPELSEEGKNIPYETRKNWKHFWLIDPLDGTKEFIKKNGEFTVNIALIEKNTPVMGVIYVPARKTLYAGIVGKGAWKIGNISSTINFQKMIVQGMNLPFIKKRNKYTIVGSRSHMNQETIDFIENIKKRHPQYEIVSVGSSLKICLVAEGSADIYPRFGPTMEWDTAAGHAIAKAAGKKMITFKEKSELVYNKKNLINPNFIVL